ncbi:MAG: cupin domain-containing protein [Sphingobium sp.]
MKTPILLLSGLALAWSSLAHAAPQRTIGDAFTVPHVYGGPDGESHIDTIALPRTSGVPGKSVQSRLYATDIELGEALPGDFIDWHGVSTPRFLIVLSGELEVGLGDGSKHILRKGDMVLAADVTGRGHTSRTIGTEPVRILTVRLPKENSLAPKLDSCPPGMAAEQCVAARLAKAAAEQAAPSDKKPR